MMSPKQLKSERERFRRFVAEGAAKNIISAERSGHEFPYRQAILAEFSPAARKRILAILRGIK